MSEQLINVEGIDLVHVRWASPAGVERRSALEAARDIPSIHSFTSRQSAYLSVEKLERLMDKASRSVSTAKAPVLALCRTIEEAHTNYIRDLENEANRLKKAIGAYNAAKEQAERKDNVA